MSQLCRKKIASLIRNRDIFGHEVKLTYKGDSQFKTLFGGIMSLIFIAIILAFMISEFKKVADYTIKIEQNTLFYDQTPHENSFAIEASDGDFVV